MSLSFSPHPPPFSLFLSLSLTGFHTTARELKTCTFEGAGALNTTKMPREDPQTERKRMKNGGAEREKSAKLWALQPSGPHPSGPGENGSNRRTKKREISGTQPFGPPSQKTRNQFGLRFGFATSPHPLPTSRKQPKMLKNDNFFFSKKIKIISKKKKTQTKTKTVTNSK